MKRSTLIKCLLKSDLPMKIRLVESKSGEKIYRSNH